MPRALTISADVTEDGHLPKDIRQRIASQLQLYRGRAVEVVIRSPKRSTQANAYLWGVVYPAIQQAMAEAGMAASCEAIHELMKRRYLPTRVADVLGEAVPLSASSADLDSTAFYDFVERIRSDEDVLALGCHIPDPEPSYKSYRITEPR